MEDYIWSKKFSSQFSTGAPSSDRPGDVPDVAGQVGGQPTYHAQSAPARRRRRLRTVRALRLGRGARLPAATALGYCRARLLAQVLASVEDCRSTLARSDFTKALIHRCA